MPRSTAAFILMFVRHRFIPHVAAFAVLGMLSMGLTGMEPLALRHLVLELQAIGSGGSQGAWPAGLVLWFGVLGGLWLAAAACDRITEVIDQWTAPKLRAAVRAYLFSYLMEHAPSYFQKNLSGRLVQKIMQAPESCIALVNIAARELLRIVVIVGIGIALLAPAHIAFAVLLVGWTVAFLWLSQRFSNRCVALSRRVSDSAATVGGRLVDVVANAPLVRSFVALERERSLLAQDLASERRDSEAIRRALVVMRCVQYTATITFQFVLIGLSIRQVTRGEMQAADFVMVFSLSNLVAMNVWALSNRLLDWFEHVGNLGAAIGLLTRSHDVVDAPRARRLEVRRGAIEIRDLVFRHVEADPVFEGLSLSIAAGEKVALVGPSGAGKSTLASLIMRHYELERGSILIDGQDIAQVTRDSLNAAIAEVPQMPGMFHRSIRDNILYARPGASESEIVAAARKAHCHEFISLRAGGYDAVVGERGVRLSGGERQRVAIARAFLKNAPILILDEATSSLDSETEQAIQDSLWRLMKGRTVVAIAHRLSTIAGMDTIYYMESGRICERGSHHDLLRQNGGYAQLWRRQIGRFLPKDDTTPAT